MWNVVFGETRVTLFLCACSKIIINKKSMKKICGPAESTQNFRQHKYLEFEVVILPVCFVLVPILCGAAQKQNSFV